MRGCQPRTLKDFPGVTLSLFLRNVLRTGRCYRWLWKVYVCKGSFRCSIVHFIAPSLYSCLQILIFKRIHFVGYFLACRIFWYHIAVLQQTYQRQIVCGFDWMILSLFSALLGFARLCSVCRQVLIPIQNLSAKPQALHQRYSPFQQ